MGKPCGCAGSCGCDIRGRNGVRVSGSGIAPDTMWIELDGSSPNACNTIMDCVGANIGNGLVYNTSLRRLTVRLSSTAGNQASFGSDGGILVTGSGGGGGAGGQTVANLPAGVNAIVGSGWGAGSLMWPEGVRDSIQAARNMVGTTVRMVYVPVRRTADGVPICLSENAISWYTGDGNPATVLEVDAREHSTLPIAPGGTPPSVEGGYFGFYSPGSTGSPTLGETFDALARRAVLALEIRGTVNPSETVDRVKEMIPQYDAQASTIVVGTPTAVTGPVGPTIIEAVSASLLGSGIPIGALFYTRQQVIDYPVSRLNTLGVTWVFVLESLVDPVDPNHVSTQVDAYRAAGLNVMLMGVSRQYQAQRAATLQLRGSIATEPVYSYGASLLYRYRRDTPSWGFSAPNTGQLSPYSDTVVGQNAHYRGYVLAGEGGQLTIPADLHNPEQVEPYPSGYWILPGEMMPLKNASTYAIQAFYRWSSLPIDRGRWVGLWLDAPTDRTLRDWSAATTQTIGYLFSMSVGTGNAQFVLTEYDGTPGVPPAARVLVDTSAPYSISSGVYYGMRAEVTPTQIRLYASTVSWPSNFNKVLVATVNNPHRYISGTNQGYCYFGRHFFNEPDSRLIKVAGLKVEYTGF